MQESGLVNSVAVPSTQALVAVTAQAPLPEGSVAEENELETAQLRVSLPADSQRVSGIASSGLLPSESQSLLETSAGETTPPIMSEDVPVASTSAMQL